MPHTDFAAAKIILIHGTWGRGFFPGNGTSVRSSPSEGSKLWFEDGSKFCSALQSSLQEAGLRADIDNFLWSGSNSIKERDKAANELAKVLNLSMHNDPDSEHFLIAHSHGGNVALVSRQEDGNRNAHVVTLATPFISVEYANLRLIDRCIAACFSFIIMAISCFMVGKYIIFPFDLLEWLMYGVAGAAIASCLVLMCSICARIQSLYRRDSQHMHDNASIKHKMFRAINNSFIFSCICSMVYSVFMMDEGVVFVFAATLLIVFVYMLIFYAVDFVLFRYILSNTVGRAVLDHRLKILRAYRDEATLILLIGKITGTLSRIAAAVSISLSVVCIAVVFYLVHAVAIYAISQYISFDLCLTTLGGRANNGECAIQGEAILFLMIGIEKFWSGYASYYFAMGVMLCVLLVIVTSVCKSTYGRELFYRSFNVIINVFDTPDGKHRDRIDWCDRTKGAALGLRHSLYENPEAIKRISDYITSNCIRT